MSALASLERFGEEDLVFINWRSCRHCLQNEWPLTDQAAPDLLTTPLNKITLHWSMISSIILDFEHDIDLVGKNSGKWKQISGVVGRKKARAKWSFLFITTFIRHVQNVGHRTGRTPGWEERKKIIVLYITNFKSLILQNTNVVLSRRVIATFLF